MNYFQIIFTWTGFGYVDNYFMSVIKLQQKVVIFTFLVLYCRRNSRDMKIQELRVGNWYTSTKWQKPVRCELSDIAEIHHRLEGAEEQYAAVDKIFQPLHLTEEWLLKFGFKKIGGYAWECLKLGRQRFIENHLTKGYFETEYGGNHIQHVHQLQNLYFALTGEELTITE